MRSNLGSINHLRLTVSDIRRAEGYYTPLLKCLGYELVERDVERLAWAGWSSHGLLQWFILSKSQPELAHLQHNRYAVGFHHLAWNTSSREAVDEFHRELIRLGVEVLDAPAEYDYEPGYYAVFFKDPDGLKLEVMHVPESGSKEYWAAFEKHGVNPPKSTAKCQC